MSEAATKDREEQPDPPPSAEMIDSAIVGEDIRFSVQTVINFLEIRPRHEWSESVQFNYDMTACAMLAAIRGMFIGKTEPPPFSPLGGN